MELYPIFMKMSGRPVLVVGGGSVGTRKVHGLLAAGTSVTLVSPVVTDFLRELADSGRIAWRARPFEECDLDGMGLAMVATNDRVLNERVVLAAHARGILVNVADVPDLCDFFLPSILERGPLMVAISTTGAAPALARRIRDELKTIFPPSLGKYVALLGHFRSEVKRLAPDKLKKVAEAMAASEARALWESGQPEAARALLKRLIEETAGVTPDDTCTD
jgi:siroheme synthase-like protein